MHAKYSGLHLVSYEGNIVCSYEILLGMCGLCLGTADIETIHFLDLN